MDFVQNQIKVISAEIEAFKKEHASKKKQNIISIIFILID
jgi:hypothetical protein